MGDGWRGPPEDKKICGICRENGGKRRQLGSRSLPRYNMAHRAPIRIRRLYKHLANGAEMSIEDMRQSYASGKLIEQDMAADPMVQFRQWFDEAVRSNQTEFLEPNAMTLSTFDGTSVHSRIVLLKGIDDGTLTFYSNYQSAKAHQIEQCANVAACFHWPHNQRQVRVTGTVTKSSRAKSEDYFQSRPRESQLGACVSEQSSVVPSREALENTMEELESRFEGRAIPCPEHWGGYEITVSQWEFWQGRPGRLHDRIRYRRDDAHSRWILERLAP